MAETPAIPEPPPPARARHVAGRALLVAAAALVGVLLFEILLRGIGFSEPMLYEPDRQFGWALRPGVAALTTKEGRAHFAVNAAGWRDEEHALTKPAGVFRIAVLGDSYAEAMQVELPETFWAQLPGQLARCGFADGKRIEVLNFAASGYGTAQEYLVLKSRAIDYRPDLVLLAFTNDNDVRNNSPALDAEWRRPFYVADDDGSLRLDDSFAGRPEFIASLSPKSYAYRKAVEVSRVAQLLNTTRNAVRIRQANAARAAFEPSLQPLVLAPPRGPLLDEAWRVTEQLVAMSADQARSHGAEFLLVTVSAAIQVHPDAAVRAGLQARLGAADLFYPDRRLVEFARRRGIDALALAPAMQAIAEAGQVHLHGFAHSGLGRGHWNADGHRVAAELIAAHLCGANS